MRDLVLNHEVANQATQFSSYVTPNQVTYVGTLKGRAELTKRSPVRGFRLPTSYGAFQGFVWGDDFYNIDPPYRAAYGHSAPPSFQVGAGHGMTGVFPDLRPQVDSNLRNRVQTEALDKIRRGDFDLGVAIAEGRQTFGMILESAHIVLPAWTAVRQGTILQATKALNIALRDWRLKGIQKKAQIPAAAWLQLEFGWKPFLSDIDESTKLFVEGWNDSAPTMSVVRRLERDAELPMGGAFEMVSTGTSSQWAEVKLYYTVDNHTMYRLNSLGLVNPATILWELVPFSFVLDWFIPVGTFLRTLTADVGTDYIGGYELLRRESIFMTSYRTHLTNGYDFSKSTYAVKNKSWWREPYLAPPLPKVYTNLRYNSRKAITTLALFTTLRKFH